jgi:GDP/UDP-N,N'-diacetylbacillosamine 2-epimerase (hydrolysing)
MVRKICIVTGSRAEYGVLKGLMSLIENSNFLDLQVVVTGAHLSSEFGNTFEIISEDGFSIDKKVDMLLSSDSDRAITKSIGLGVIGLSDAFYDLKPDIIILTGDRYEMVAASIAASTLRIKIAHLHGGEITEGAYDDAFRHSITKMSHLHFVATSSYRNRVIQMGEQPESVINVGGLSIDSISNTKILSKNELESELNYKFQDRNFLVTFHPVTLQPDLGVSQLNTLLEVLDSLKDTGFIFTMSNSDSGGRGFLKIILRFCSLHKNAVFYDSLGQQKYYSCLNYFDCVIGNSSSGIVEAPTFRKASINIGNRQSGRDKSQSVIDCNAEKESIREAIKTAFSYDFQLALKSVKNVYGDGGAHKKILEYLEYYNNNSLVKKFYDIDNLDLG